MIDYRQCFDDLRCVRGIDSYLSTLENTVTRTLAQSHGNLPRWLDAIAKLPNISRKEILLDRDTIQLGTPAQFNSTERQTTIEQLMELHPWRKGPFQIGDIFIDTEWRSDWKWNRLQHEITSLKNRTVLDIGCGSGYHCLRMLGDGARIVLGIDPMVLYAVQFLAIKHFTGPLPAHVLPLGIDDLPEAMPVFDTVFSMGVLYHRRSPIDHLLHLKALLRPKGELVLETLVVEGSETDVILPRDRYAKMRNVWFIPSTKMLTIWLLRAGFTGIRLVNVSTTTRDEQRKTDWMRFESLDDFLDPSDATKTIEGYPAPVRAIFIATAP